MQLLQSKPCRQSVGAEELVLLYEKLDTPSPNHPTPASSGFGFLAKRGNLYSSTHLGCTPRLNFGYQ